MKKSNKVKITAKERDKNIALFIKVNGAEYNLWDLSPKLLKQYPYILDAFRHVFNLGAELERRRLQEVMFNSDKIQIQDVDYGQIDDECDKLNT